MYCEIRFKDKKKRVDYIANGENGKLKISYPDCDRLGFRTIAEARNAVLRGCSKWAIPATMCSPAAMPAMTCVRQSGAVCSFIPFW